MIVIDTNLLVYAHRSRTLEHEGARSAIDQARTATGGWGIALPSVLEFWSVVTHPASTGRPSSPEEAKGFIGGLVSAGARVLVPNTDIAARLLDVASRGAVAGPRVFDLLIALIARDNRATEIWTHDHGFVSLPGLPVVDPLAAA